MPWGALELEDAFRALFEDPRSPVVLKVNALVESCCSTRITDPVANMHDRAMLAGIRFVREVVEVAARPEQQQQDPRRQAARFTRPLRERAASWGSRLLPGPLG